MTMTFPDRPTIEGEGHGLRKESHMIGTGTEEDFVPSIVCHFSVHDRDRVSA